MNPFRPNLRRYDQTIIHRSLLMIETCSPCESGSRTKLQNWSWETMSGLHRQNVASVVIRRQSNHGHQSRYAVASLRIVYPRCTCVSLGMVNPKTLANIAGLWMTSSESFPKMKSHNALHSRSSGMLTYHLRIFSESKIIMICWVNIANVVDPQGIQEDSIRSCRVDAVHEASERSSVLHVGRIY